MGAFLLISVQGDAKGLQIVYVPSHLYHMLFELFKNSMRAVMEHHGTRESYPPIIVTIVKGKEDICVKVTFRFLFLKKSRTRLFISLFSTDVRQGRRYFQIGNGTLVQVHVLDGTSAEQE